MSDKEVADKIVNKALAKVRDRKPAPGAVSDKQKDDKAIHAIIQEWCGEGTIGVMRHKIVEYITTARRDARAAAFTAIGAELCKYGANIPKVDLMARFQHVFREIEAAASDAEGGGDG